MLLDYCAVAAFSVAATLYYALDNDAVHSYSAFDVVPWPRIALRARSGPTVGPKSMVWLQITLCLAYVLLLGPWAGTKVAVRLCSDVNRCVHEASSR